MAWSIILCFITSELRRKILAASRQDNDNNDKSADDYYNNRAKITKNKEAKPKNGKVINKSGRKEQ